MRLREGVIPNAVQQIVQRDVDGVEVGIKPNGLSGGDRHRGSGGIGEPAQETDFDRERIGGGRSGDARFGDGERARTRPVVLNQDAEAHRGCGVAVDVIDEDAIRDGSGGGGESGIDIQHAIRGGGFRGIGENQLSTIPSLGHGNRRAK